MDSKMFLVSFSRGSLNCFDEVIYIIVDIDIENVKKRVQDYFCKYFSGDKWLVGITDLSKEKDDLGFYLISERYSE